MIPGLLGLNWPNRLTILRILLVPVFVISLLYRKNTTALGVFCLASVTDGLDGFLARAYNQKTKLGTFLDPLADKLLLSSAYIVMAAVDHLPVWLAVLVMSRDIIILSGLITLYLLNEPLHIAPTVLGKVTTFTQISAVFLVLFQQVAGAEFTLAASGTIFLVALLTVSSGLHYVYIGVNQLNNGSTRPNY
ncbi:MAG: CDP-diacylglycerol--glycerol-3-phosphate 3-phosphatidyltransferase [bacterium]